MGARPGKLEPIHPDMKRQRDERQAFFAKRENLERYPDKVVAVYQGRVWGYGNDHGEALRSAAAELQRCAGQADTPTANQLVYLAVPDVVMEESPLPDY